MRILEVSEVRGLGMLEVTRVWDTDEETPVFGLGYKYGIRAMVQ